MDINFQKLRDALRPIDRDKPETGSFDIDITMGRIVDLILFYSGVFIMIAIIYSGVMYITAAGNAEKAEAAKKSLIATVIGEVIIIAAVIIKKAIEDALLKGTNPLES